MGQFLQQEKLNQTLFKSKSETISDGARMEGVYKNLPRPFCLPANMSEENLFPEIRNSAIDFFSKKEIKWHDGQFGKPSNHLCDSQVCCVNFLYPFSNRPAALKKLLLKIFPEIVEMLPVEEGQYVSFEWIGLDNYLSEKIRRNGSRSRGANFTSADAIVMFKRKDSLKQIVLIEWKYTESYGSTNLIIAASGTDRSLVYRPLFEVDDCPINKNILPKYEALFYEPFYQFFRQQLLAHQMEKANEMGANIVSVLHISPRHNEDFFKITSPDLSNLGSTATNVWTNIMSPQHRFISTYSEDLFGHFPINEFPDMKYWFNYVNKRYCWIGE